jgi:hypothetical protein
LSQQQIFKAARFERIAAALEDFLGGVPRSVRTPRGATQFIGPNGNAVRFDISLSVVR